MNNVLLHTNLSKSQIQITNTHYNIKGIPVTVDDAVMNRVHYPEDENQKGMGSLVGKPMTLGHPKDNGYNVSGREGKGLADYFSGGTITNTYNKDGVWYADTSIKKGVLKAQDGGERFANALETEKPIGVSTGLAFSANHVSGVNKKGQEYDKQAINQRYDHLAMLLDEKPAGGEDTVMRFNEEVEVIHVNDLLPDAVEDKMEREEDRKEDEAEMKMFRKILSSVKNKLKSNPVKTNDAEVDPMKKMLVNALNEAGINTDDLSDEQILAQYNAEMKKKSYEKLLDTDKMDDTKKADKEEEEAKKDKDKVEKLEKRLNELETKLQANEALALQPKIDAILAANSDLAAEDLVGMSEKLINSMYSKTKHAAPLVGGFNSVQTNSVFGDDYAFGDK